jgi:Flp pilus assembly protein TadG
MKLRTHCYFQRRGATVVETAFVLLIAVTLTFAIYDYGRYFMLSQLVNNAAREGARQAVANTNTQNTAMIQNTVVQYSNWYDAPFGSSIMVQVNAKYTSLFPSLGFLPTTVNLQGTAVMSSEAN